MSWLKRRFEEVRPLGAHSLFGNCVLRNSEVVSYCLFRVPGCEG